MAKETLDDRSQAWYLWKEKKEGRIEQEEPQVSGTSEEVSAKLQGSPQE